MPDDRRHAGSDRTCRARRQACGKQHAARALRDVDEHDEERSAETGRAVHVGGAHVAAADAAQIDPLQPIATR